VIAGQIRKTNPLLYLSLFAVEIKVYKHLQRLFLVSLSASRLLQYLLQISSSFRLISLRFSVLSRRRRSRMPSAMQTF